MSDVTEIQSEEEFLGLVDSSDEVIVKFWAPWCVPCGRLAPHYSKAAESTDKPMLSVDIDQHNWAVSMFGIQGVPTVIRLKGRDDRVDIAGRTVVQLLSEIND